MATYTGFFDVANALVGPTVGIIVSGVGYQTAFLFTGAMSLVALAILLLNVGPQERGQTQMVSVELFRVR